MANPDSWRSVANNTRNVKFPKSASHKLSGDVYPSMPSVDDLNFFVGIMSDPVYIYTTGYKVIHLLIIRLWKLNISGGYGLINRL